MCVGPPTRPRPLARALASLASLTCCCCLRGALAAPFMSTGLRQSLLKNTNETADLGGSWDTLEIESSQFHHTNSSGGAESGGAHELDMWSVMWYLGAFGGLVTFFLIVTCSEWCFGNHMYTRHGVNELYINAYQSNFHQGHRVSDTPPPPYDLFAPPSYSELFGKGQEGKKKNKFSIFIIPVHRRQSTSPAS